MSHSVARDICRQIIKIICTIFLLVSTLPALFFLLIPSVILRLIVGVIARAFRRDLAESFYGKGVLLALPANHEAPNLTMLSHLVFDGSLSVDKIRLAFQQEILTNDCNSYLHLRQTWTQFCGFLFWKCDTNFNLSHHIRNYDFEDSNLTLPDLCTEADLQRVTSALISESYKEGKSPWEILVIPNYRAANNTSGKGQSVAVFRFHHALLDAYSMMSLMFKIFPVQASNVPQPNFPQLPLLRRIWSCVVMPLRLAYAAVSQLVDGLDCSNNNKSSSWHLSNKKKSPRKYHTFFSNHVSVNQIKEIKNKYGVSYNVAAYSIAIGGVRRLMMEAGQEIPRSMSCFVPLPLPKRPEGLAFHVGGFHFHFSPRLQFPAERMRQIWERTRVFYDASAVPMLLSSWGEFLALLPVFALKFVQNHTGMALVMTSVPGPECELDTIGTAKLVDIMVAVSLPTNCYGAVGVLVSMAGRQRFVLTVDQDAFPSSDVPFNFAKHIQDEVQDLL